MSSLVDASARSSKRKPRPDKCVGADVRASARERWRAHVNQIGFDCRDAVRCRKVAWCPGLVSRKPNGWCLTFSGRLGLTGVGIRWFSKTVEHGRCSRSRKYGRFRPVMWTSLSSLQTVSDAALCGPETEPGSLRARHASVGADRWKARLLNRRQIDGAGRHNHERQRTHSPSPHVVVGTWTGHLGGGHHVQHVRGCTGLSASWESVSAVTEECVQGVRPSPWPPLGV